MQFLCRSGQALRFPGGRGPQISKQSTHEGGKFFSPTPSRHRKYLWYSFLLEAVSTPRPSGIEPATYRLAAQCLDELRHCVPHNNLDTDTIFYTESC
jgi:hypothetical protein